MKKKICSKCGREINGQFCEICGGKPKKNNTILVVVVVFFVLIFIGAISSSGDDENNNEQSVNKGNNVEEKVDLSSIAREYELTSGYYTAGVDLPIGKCNITAISGTGNVSTSNMFTGGLNEMMGVGDPDMYEVEFTGLNMSKDVVLDVSNGVKIKLTYTDVTGGFKEREYDESKAIELSSGNYVAGTDFPIGVYNIIAVNGSGNVSSSNMFNGGINAIMGINEDSMYEREYKNIEFKNTVELSVSGVTIKLVPEK